MASGALFFVSDLNGNVFQLFTVESVLVLVLLDIQFIILCLALSAVFFIINEY